MSGIDADEVVVGADGRVFVAPEGTAVPDDLASLSNTWINLGYVSEEGITFKNGQEVEDIPAWQSFYSIRKVVSGKSTGVEFVLKQWNSDTLKLAFGGGDVVDNDPNDAVIYVPPAPGVMDNRAMIIEWEDGLSSYRLVMPRGMVSGEAETNIVRTSAADLPIAFDVTPSGVAEALSTPPTANELATQPWYLITDGTQFTT